MKLGKEEIQKIALSTLMLIALLYGYFSLLLDPLDKGEKAAHSYIDDLKSKIAPAEASVREAKELELKAPGAISTLDQVKAMIPDGAPVAWFPQRISEFFKRQGIEKCTARAGTELGEKELTGFKKLGWTLDIPAVDTVPLAIAVAALENEQLLMEVTSIQIDALKDNVQYQRAVLNVSTIVKQ
jgi:type II secretory pathway component PulM